MKLVPVLAILPFLATPALADPQPLLKAELVVLPYAVYLSAKWCGDHGMNFSHDDVTAVYNALLGIKSRYGATAVDPLIAQINATIDVKTFTMDEMKEKCPELYGVLSTKNPANQVLWGVDPVVPSPTDSTIPAP